jgi:carbonic anhydrase
MKKNIFLELLVALSFIGSCNAPDRMPPGGDSISKVSQPAAGADTAKAGKDSGNANGKEHAENGSSARMGDNMVKSEAPDAATNSDQGYAMDKHGEGMAQSPVNIVTSKAEKGGGARLAVVFHGDVTAVENLGHTVQVDFADGGMETVYGRGYSPRQFHFHTPSEHLIDGITYPMEMHIVGTVQDSTGGKNTSFVVIGVLFKMGNENKFIREFQENIPAEEGKNALKNGSVSMKDLVSAISQGAPITCYTYRGSLTTPPFTERVDWIVLDHPIEASPAQILAIEKREGNNARHVQALYARTVAARPVSIEIK